MEPRFIRSASAHSHNPRPLARRRMVDNTGNIGVGSSSSHRNSSILCAAYSVASDDASALTGDSGGGGGGGGSSEASTTASSPSFATSRSKQSPSSYNSILGTKSKTRPPGQRVDDGDEKLPSASTSSKSSSFRPYISQQKQQHSPAAAATTPTKPLMRHDSLHSFASSELDNLSWCQQSVHTTVSGRRPPPPPIQQSPHQPRHNWLRSSQSTDSIKSFASTCDSRTMNMNMHQSFFSSCSSEMVAQQQVDDDDLLSCIVQTPTTTQPTDDAVADAAADDVGRPLTPPCLLRTTMQSSVHSHPLHNNNNNTISTSSDSSTMLFALTPNTTTLMHTNKYHSQSLSSLVYSANRGNHEHTPSSSSLFASPQQLDGNHSSDPLTTDSSTAPLLLEWSSFGEYVPPSTATADFQSNNTDVPLLSDGKDPTAAAAAPSMWQPTGHCFQPFVRRASM